MKLILYMLAILVLYLLVMLAYRPATRSYDTEVDAETIRLMAEHGTYYLICEEWDKRGEYYWIGKQRAYIRRKL